MPVKPERELVFCHSRPRARATLSHCSGERDPPRKSQVAGHSSRSICSTVTRERGAALRLPVSSHGTQSSGSRPAALCTPLWTENHQLAPFAQGSSLTLTFWLTFNENFLKYWFTLQRYQFGYILMLPEIKLFCISPKYSASFGHNRLDTYHMPGIPKKLPFLGEPDTRAAREESCVTVAMGGWAATRRTPAAEKRRSLQPPGHSCSLDPLKQGRTLLHDSMNGLNATDLSA